MGNSQIQALIVRQYGDWDAVRLEQVEAREPGPDDLLIETRAASLNFPDILMIEGKYQDKPPLPFIPGRDAAGIVLRVGERVRDFAIGDRVVATPSHGAFAQQTIAPAIFCQKLPASISFEDAAACGTIVPTVVAAISLRAKLRRGEWMLISGAAGGVGSAAIQYARALGGRVVALVSSEAKETLARTLGAEIVVRSDRIAALATGLRKALQDQGLDGVDAAMDVVGGDTFDGMIRCIKPEGRLVIVGFASGRIPTVAANYLLLKDIAAIGSSITRLYTSGHPEFAQLCRDALGMVADGRIHAQIEARYRLDEFANAALRIANREVLGKIVLLPPAGGLA